MTTTETAMATEELFPNIGPAERRAYLAIGRARAATRLTRQRMSTKPEKPSPFISLAELGEIIIAYRKAHPELQIVAENEALEVENKKLKAKIAAVEKVMAGDLMGEEPRSQEEIYNALHAAIYSDQWEHPGQDELRAQLAAFQAVAVQMVPGEHGEGVEAPATPDFLKNLIAGLQKEWDGAETQLSELKAERDGYSLYSVALECIREAKSALGQQAKPVAADWMRAAAEELALRLDGVRNDDPEITVEDLIKPFAKHCPNVPAQDSRDSARLHWLHEGGSKDPEGFEWGIFRVKWDENGRPVQVWQTLSDFSDLDAEMARERSAMAAKKTNLQ